MSVDRTVDRTALAVPAELPALHTITVPEAGTPRLDAAAESALCVFVALAVEARALRTALPEADVVRTGMGPERAGRVARQVFAEVDAEVGEGRPQCPMPVAVTGFCGGLAPGVRAGDVVVASEVRRVGDGTDGADGGPVIACPSSGLLVAALRRRGVTVHHGPLVCTDSVVHGGEKRRLAGTGALAVDMESAWVAAAAGDRPLAVVRVVVDTVEHGLVSSATLRAGVDAYRTLRDDVGPALASWAAAVADRRVLLAGPRSFCAGVERAIDIVERALERYPTPVYVRKQIVHNVHVVRNLEARGAVFVDELDEVPAGATVVLSAHGVAPEVRDRAAERELLVVDATCPLVSKVHAEARRFARNPGTTILLIGHAGHEEVEGTLGEAPGAMRLVESLDDVATVDVPDPEQVAYLMQTTLAVDEAESIAAGLRKRFPALAGPESDDICYATSNRQDAVRAIARDCDVVLVVGSRNSSNSRRLVEVVQREGSRAYLVDDETEIHPEWLVGAACVGVTAGASAPPMFVDRVVSALSGLGTVEVSERTVVQETLQFQLPKEVS